MLIAGTILMFAIELQLCLVVAASLPNLKNARRAMAVRRDEMSPVAKSRGELRSAIAMREGLCETSSCVRERSLPIIF